MQKYWNTYYIYHNDGADHLLTEIIHPSIQNIQEKIGQKVKFFFIRYFENGYHIRLRLLLSVEESPLFRSLLKDCISDYEWLNKVSLVVKEAQYIQETDRYGNSDTIVFAENQFYASSQFVLHHLLENTSLTASERYLLAIKTHIAFFKGMGLSPNYIQKLCDMFVQSWLPVAFSENSDRHEQNRKTILSVFQQQFEVYQTLLYENLSEFWNSLDVTTDPYLQQFMKVNREVWKEYAQYQLPSDTTDEVLLSFIHMTNNRFGIINSEESYLLFLIMQTISLFKDYDNKPKTQ